MEHKKTLPGQSEEDLKVRERMDKIARKIMVMSGKGGVGKSTIAVNLAYALALRNFRVGLLDIDIHGPSVGRLAGIEGIPLMTADNGEILPIEMKGVRVVTMASLLESDDQPVIWRGPMKMSAIRQFLGDISWGELDYLIVDCPPGTGDEPLTVAQLVPGVTGSVIVTTPQDVSLLDARKTIKFSELLGIKVLGVIENMSGFVCPHCGGTTEVFKCDGGKKTAEELDLPFLGALPLEVSVMQSGEKGIPFVLSLPESTSAKVLFSATDAVISATDAKKPLGTIS